MSVKIPLSSSSVQLTSPKHTIKQVPITSQQLKQKQLHFQKQKDALLQKIQFLEQQLKQYHQREAANKKINQSIMITYQQTQNMREQHVTKSIKSMAQRHQQEIKRIKELAYREKKIIEDNLVEYKSKYQQALIDNDRKNLQFNKKILEINKKFQQRLKRQLQQKQADYQSKIQLLTQKLKQAQGMAEVYKQFVQKRRQNYTEQDQSHLIRLRENSIINANKQPDQKSLKNVRYSVQNLRTMQNYNNFYQQCNQNINMNQKQNNNKKACRKSRLKDIQQSNANQIRRLSASRQSVKQLTMKIERAVTHLKGSNNSKLHERINEKLAKRLG